MSKAEKYDRADPYWDRYQDKIERTYQRYAVHMVIGIFLALSTLLMLSQGLYSVAGAPNNVLIWLTGVGVSYALGSWLIAFLRVMPLKRAIAERSK